MRIENLALLNFALCLGLFWYCICGLNSHRSKVYKAVRARYALLAAGALFKGLQPSIFGVWPTPADLVFSAVVLAFFALGMMRRRGDDTR